MATLTAPRTAATQPAPKRRRRLPFSGWHFFLLPTALLFVLPFVQMVSASIQPIEEMRAYPPPFLPQHPTFGGYLGLFRDTDIARWLLNSTIVATVGIVSNLVLCSLAGYGFARLKFLGRNMAFMAIVGTIMIPTQLLMIPTYIMFSYLGLVDTLAAAMVPWLAGAFGIFLMRQFFLSIPKELEEAAFVDGATRLKTFWFIVLPLAKPAMATLAIFTLLGTWNDLIWPLIAINNEHAFTMQLGLATFQGTRHTEWQLLMAGNVVATAPLVLFFLVAQKHFIATMTMSGMKG